MLKIDRLCELLKQEDDLGCLEATLDVLINGNEMFKSGDVLQDLIDYLIDDISYAKEL